jgi:hypothetical protein
MEGNKHQMQRFHIFSDQADPDVFLVVRDASGPRAVAVIPTALAESYWVHPSWTALSTAT